MMMEKATVNSSGEGERGIQKFLSYGLGVLCVFPGAGSFCSCGFSLSGSRGNYSSSLNPSLSPSLQYSSISVAFIAASDIVN